MTRVAPPADLMTTMIAATRRIVEVRQQRESLRALAGRAESAGKRSPRFLSALGGSGRVNIIAECKRRSPSRGVLRADYNPVAIARGYADAGAVAISVLTEPTFFDGSIEHLRAVAAAVEIPVLRKDFIVSEYQLLEAKAAGADAALLIVAAVETGELRSLVSLAATLGLDALVEVHDSDELSAAVDVGARIIGVNNRDLRTLEVDVDVSERLIARIPSGVVAVSESGLRSTDDLVRLSRMGYRAFLIGERFMTEPEPGTALEALLAACRS